MKRRTARSLRVRLFGTVSLTLAGRPLPPFPTRRSEALFAFLALHTRRPCRREELADAFWRDRPEAVARKCLRTELWRARSVVEPDGVPAGTFLTVSRAGIALNREADVWIDVVELERAAAAMVDRNGHELGGADRSALASAIDLYSGDLLEGHDYEWCVSRRELLRSLHQTALERLIEDALRHDEWRQTVLLALRLLAREPLLEHVHRSLMRAYRGLGEPGLGVRHYRALRDLLRRELDIEPMPETAALAAAIQAGGSPPAETARPGRAAGDGVRHLVARLRLLCTDLRRTSARLDAMIERLEPSAARSARALLQSRGGFRL